MSSTPTSLTAITHGFGGEIQTMVLISSVNLSPLLKSLRQLFPKPRQILTQLLKVQSNFIILEEMKSSPTPLAATRPGFRSEIHAMVLRKWEVVVGENKYVAMYYILGDILAQERVRDSLGGDLNVCFVHCDVTVEDDLRHVVYLTVLNFNTLDIMVINASISGSPCNDIREFKLSEIEKVFDVNVKGTFLSMKHASRIMIPLRKGVIVSLCSVASALGGLGPHAYTGSKHVVIGLMRSVAAELGQYGISVNCVSPYVVFTNLAFLHLPEDERTDDVKEGFRLFVAKKENLNGVELTPNDVVDSVLFLAFDEARYISWTNLMVDAGYTSTITHSKCS